MTSNFYILSGSTVSNTFKWNGIYPTTSSNATFVGYDIEGYAPELTVSFKNTSTLDNLTTNDYAYYIWDFGDYYNQYTNTITTSSKENVSHTYTMPGKYSVSLTIQENILSLLSIVTPITENKCFGKFCKTWNWLNLQSNTPNFLTWKDVSTIGNNTATWGNSKIVDASCNTQTSNYYAVSYTQSSLIDAIEVLEILPIAKLHTNINPAIGTSPLTIQICPSASLCGSFPYERIIWDFGDGSDIKTVTRYSTPDTSFIYTGAYPNDINDPRNYNAIHTYTKIVSSISSFYPSITAYSMNTNQNSIANTVVGPISYDTINSAPLHIMKVRNSINGNMYGIQTGNNFSIINTKSRAELTTFPTIRTIDPVHPIIIPILGKNACYIGFGAGTGSRWNEHWLYDMTWNSDYQNLLFSGFLQDSILLGNAININNLIRLTPNIGDTSGNIYYNNPQIIIDKNGNLIDWNATFTVAMGGGYGHADGLSFILQSNTNIAGGGGGGLGYSSILNSISVSLDTFYNSEFDPNTNHVEIDVNGDVASSLITASPIFTMSTPILPIYGVQGTPVYVWVDYVSSIMNIYISQTNIKPNTALISYAIDLRTYLTTTTI